MIILEPDITTEHVLELALFAQMVSEVDRPAPESSVFIITDYIMNELGDDLPEDEEEATDMVTAKFTQMVVDYTLASLTKRGLVDTTFGEDGEIYHRITEEGKKFNRET